MSRNIKNIDYLSIPQIAQIVERYLLSENPKIGKELHGLDYKDKISILAGTPQWTFLQIIDQYLVCRLSQKHYSVILKQQELVGVGILPGKFIPGFLFVRKFFEYQLYLRQMQKHEIKELISRANEIQISDYSDELLYLKDLIRLIQEYELTEFNPIYVNTEKNRKMIKQQLDNEDGLFDSYMLARPELFYDQSVDDADNIDKQKLKLKNNIPFFRLLFTNEKSKVLLESAIFELMYVIALTISIIIWPKVFNSTTLFLWLVILTLLFAITLINIKSQLYLNSLAIVLLVLSIVLRICLSSDISDVLLGSLILGIGPLLIYIFSNGGWIGFGDVKYGFIAGIILGVKLSILSIALNIIIISVMFAVVYWANKHIKDNYISRIPTGIMWLSSIVISVLFGQSIISLIL